MSGKPSKGYLGNSRPRSKSGIISEDASDEFMKRLSILDGDFANEGEYSLDEMNQFFEEKYGGGQQKVGSNMSLKLERQKISDPETKQT